MVNQPNDNTDLEEIAAILQRRLSILEKQQALYGALAVPSHIILEKEETERELNVVLAKLGRASNSQPNHHATGISSSTVEEYKSLDFTNQTQQLSDLKVLREIIARHFNLEELQLLCFDLGVDYENVTGQSKNNKALEIVTHCQRHNSINTLINLVKKLRPNIAWNKTS